MSEAMDIITIRLKHKPQSKGERLKMRRWKEITGYEGMYLISDDALVLSIPRTVIRKGSRGNCKRKARFVKPHERGNGRLTYLGVTLSKMVNQNVIRYTD